MKPALRTAAVLCCCLMLIAARPTGADEKPAPAPANAGDWMKTKLEMSQNILAALTKGDFEAVETTAQKMNVVNFLEKLVSSDKPQYKEYTRQLNAFETANRELLRQSHTKNIEGATLAYVQLTVSCVQCHKVVRDAKK